MERLTQVLSALILPFMLVALLMVGLAACTGTKLAYETAQTLDAKAYVVTEHYAALVREANDLAEQGAPRELVERMQAADERARPLVLQLRSASEAYTTARTAENEEQLQEALNAAAVEISTFIAALRNR